MLYTIIIKHLAFVKCNDLSKKAADKGVDKKLYKTKQHSDVLFKSRFINPILSNFMLQQTIAKR